MMVAIMSWEKLGAEVRERRIELGLTQEQLVERGGPSTPTLRAIENDRAGRLSPRLRRSLERALQWSAGSVDRVLAGEAATVLNVATTTTTGPDFYLLLDQTLSVARALIVGPPTSQGSGSAADWRADMHRRVRGVQETFAEVAPRLEAEKRGHLGSVIAVLNDLLG
jgi:transcriptional regulator with XRE-family HTH domain